MGSLTSRERLRRCCRHLELDRPGLFLRGVTESSPPHPSYEPLRRLGATYGDQKSHWDYGRLIESHAISRHAEPHSADFERHVKIEHTPAGDLRSSYLAGLKGQPGMPEKHLLKTVGDAERYLSLPRPKIGGDVESFFEADRRAGDRGIVETHLGLNPAGFVAELFGSDRFALFSIEHREVLHALMKQRTEHLAALVQFLAGRGVGPYFAILGQEYVTPPLHGPQDFAEFCVRYDRAIADAVHEAGGFLHVHCHGPLQAVLAAFIDLGADVLHPIEPPPMGDVTAKEAKTVLRGRVCIEGNIQIGDMYTHTADAVRAQVERLIEDAFDDAKGLIVCPTASPYVPEMTPQCYDNYAALVDVVVNWGAS